MDALPPQKFQPRPWRFGRKRRRSGTEATESEGKFTFFQLIKFIQLEYDTSRKMNVIILLF